MSTIAERVAAGAAWLDENKPGWVDKVVVETLEMQSGCACVLGQVFGGFWEAPIDFARAGALGFDADSRPGWDTGADFMALAAEWRRVITERRAAA